MPLHRQSVKVLRFWYRISLMSEVQALSHPAFRWFYGLTMQWNGHNNGVLEFTRRRHAAQYGLTHPEVFEKARRDVLGTGLVMVTYAGGHSVSAQYALVTLPIQAPARTAQVGTGDVPSQPQKDGTGDVPSDAKTGTGDVPTRYGRRTNKTAPYRRSRARLNRNIETQTVTLVSTDPQCPVAANVDWPGEAKSAEGAGTPEPASLNGAADLPRTGSLER